MSMTSKLQWLEAPETKVENHETYTHETYTHVDSQCCQCSQYGQYMWVLYNA
jgi:hypothetical protein